MRVWVGEEMEWRNRGKKTMFVESSYLGLSELTVVSELLSERSDIEAIYFGAGRKDVTGVNSSAFSELLRTCFLKGYKITLETSDINIILSDPYLTDSIALYQVMLVNRFDVSAQTDAMQGILGNLVYKIDNQEVAIFTQFKTDAVTDITTVRDGMYKGVDEVIFSED